MSTEKQYCTFFVEGLLFGVEVLSVQEIMSHYKLAPVPLSSSTVAGLVNHRGQIVTAIDMRRRLEVSENKAQSSRMLVVRNENETFSLLVDKIGDVLYVSSNDF